MARIGAAVLLIISGTVIAWFYSQYVSATATGNAFLDALLGGFGNTVHADFALICGMLIVLHHFVSRSSGSKNIGVKIAMTVVSKIIGLIVYLAISLTLFANGTVIYVKFFSEGAQTVRAMTGNGVAEVVICLMCVAYPFLPKHSCG